MNTRALGRTGLRVSEVSLGGLFFGKLANGRDTGATVRRAAELGVNLIDTAIGYTGSEEDLGRALAGGLREKFTLVTKWWPYLGNGPGIRQNPADLRNAVEGSLKRLRTDRVEIFLFHSLTFPRDIGDVLNGPLYPELQRLQRRGLIRFIGLSNSGNDDPDDDRLQDAARSGKFDIVMPEFNLFRQRAVRNALPVYEQTGVGVLAIMPLGQAAWGYGLRDREYLKNSLKTLREKGKLADAAGLDETALDPLLDAGSPTIAAAALRFCLSFPEVSTVCCGTNDPAHLEENVRTASAGPFDPGRMQRMIDRFGAL